MDINFPAIMFRKYVFQCFCCNRDKLAHQFKTKYILEIVPYVSDMLQIT